MNSSRGGFNFITDEMFDKLTIKVHKNSAIILKGTKKVEEHPGKMGVAVSNIGDILMLRKMFLLVKD